MRYHVILHDFGTTTPINPSRTAIVTTFSEGVSTKISQIYEKKSFFSLKCTFIEVASLYRSSCVQMRSQPQLRNDKYIMMQYTNWINSTPSQQ